MFPLEMPKPQCLSAAQQHRHGTRKSISVDVWIQQGIGIFRPVDQTNYDRALPALSANTAGYKSPGMGGITFELARAAGKNNSGNVQYKQGLFVKAGTPPAIVAAYQKALLEALAQAELRTKLSETGTTVALMGGRELQAFVKPQAELYKHIVKAARISVE